MQETNKQGTWRRAMLRTGAVVFMTTALPKEWRRPLVNRVMLPAHAQTSSGCDDEVMVRVFEFDVTPPSGGDAAFLIEISAAIPSGVNLEVQTASVNTGALFGVSLPAPLSFTRSITFGWQGPGRIGSAEPLQPTTLILTWDCVEADAFTREISLNALVQAST